MFIRRDIYSTAGCLAEPDHRGAEFNLQLFCPFEEIRSDDPPPYVNSSRIFYEILNEVFFRVCWWNGRLPAGVNWGFCFDSVN